MTRAEYFATEVARCGGMMSRPSAAGSTIPTIFLTNSVLRLNVGRGSLWLSRRRAGRCVFHAAPTGVAHPKVASSMTTTTTTASTDPRHECDVDWQTEFSQLLPSLERRLRFAFCELAIEEREEAVQECICLACRSFARLALDRRTHVASAVSLVHYATAGYRSGRRLGAALNVNDICSRHCQLRRGVKVERFGDAGQANWQEALVEDHTVTPAELAASRIDYPAFLERLSRRDRDVAEILATGESTSRVAKLFGLSIGRVSQLRRELYLAWQEFHGSVDADVCGSAA